MAYTRRLPISEIKNEITSATVEFAEDFGKYLGTTDIKNSVNQNGRSITIKYPKLTTSQLRKFFGEVKRQEMIGYHKTDFILLKPKLAYAVGRSTDKNSKIKDFYEVLSEMIDQVSNEKEFRRFIKIFEAIVAYHKVAENQ